MKVAPGRLAALLRCVERVCSNIKLVPADLKLPYGSNDTELAPARVQPSNSTVSSQQLRGNKKQQLTYARCNEADRTLQPSDKARAPRLLLQELIGA